MRSYVASRPKSAAIIILTLTVVFILVLSGLVLVLTSPDTAPYPSDDLPLQLVEGNIIYTQEAKFGDFPYTGMKLLFRASIDGTSVTMPADDFGDQSLLSTGFPSTVHQVLRTSSWTNASIDITDSTGDGSFDIGDTIVFEMVPLPDDMVFTVGLLWTLGDGGGAVMEISFVVHDGRLYGWYSNYLGDWYRPYLSYV